MSDLPNSWSQTTLGEIGRYLNGKAFKATDWKTSGRPIIRIQNLTGSGAEFNYFQGEIEDRYIVKSGDLLFSWSATLGTYIWKGPEAVLNQHIFKVESQIDPRFHRYLLDFKIQEMYANTHGSGMVHITKKTFEAIQVFVPPLPEQHKIVEILENHISRLDVALADVKQAKVKAAQFRRSFIHEMTSSIEGSEVMGILDICDVYQPKTISTKELISDGEFPVYGANGQIGFYDKYNHEESEVTVTCRGATCGTVNVIPPMSWITGNAMVFKPKDNRIQKGFLEYVLRGMDWTSLITGTAQPQITRTSIQDLFLDVPNPQIQRAIYMKLESVLMQVLNALKLCERVESQVASLRRSLLQAAFTGQLTKEVASV
jgi:restriction endonuclease S subunit